MMEVPSLPTPTPVFNDNEISVGYVSACEGVSVKQMPSLGIAIDTKQQIPPDSLVPKEPQKLSLSLSHCCRG